MVDVLVRDAGLGKGLGAGDAERARGGDDYFVAPAKAGVQSNYRNPRGSWIPAFAGMTVGLTIGVSTLSPVPRR